MYFEWLNIASFHPFFRSQKMDCLGIFPNEKTQKWLKNHRHVWKFTHNELKISVSTNNNQPEILPTNEEIVLEFYLGVNDNSFQQYTDIDESPIFYKQHYFEYQFNEIQESIIELALKDGNIQDKDVLISLPPGYQKFGNFKIKISKPYDFFVSCIHKKINQIVFKAEVKSYFLFYAIKNETSFKKIPNLIEEEGQKVTFLQANVDNSDYVFFRSTEAVKITELNTLESYSYWVSPEGSKTKLRVKTPNFSLQDLGKSPTYPHFQALLKEIKV